MVMTQHIGRDTEQPRPRVGPGRVEPLAIDERLDEDLRDDLLSGIDAGPSRRVGEQPVDVAFEDLTEVPGITDRRSDDRGIRTRGAFVDDRDQPPGRVPEKSPRDSTWPGRRLWLETLATQSFQRSEETSLRRAP